MTTVNDILMEMEAFAPPALAETWDNVGLLVGRAQAEIHTVLTALDVTEAVVREAAGCGAGLIVAHHPVIFGGVKRVTDEDATGRTLLALMESRVAAICMHTNLDAADGGVNDCLAAALGVEGAEALASADNHCKAGEVAQCAFPDFMEMIRARLSCGGLRYVDAGRPVRRVAVGSGSCGEYVRAVYAAGCDTFVTADVKYNYMLEAAALGLNVVDAGHFPTEDVVVGPMTERLSARFPSVRFLKSRAHGDTVRFA